MDYGIIFLIIIVIIIIVAIILLIFANRNNVTNILASLPNYRIQVFDNPSTANNNYLGLKSTTQYTPNTIFPINTVFPSTNTIFWQAFVYSGLSSNDSFGIWKIENLSGNINDPITSGSEVRIINDVYNLQTTTQTGFIGISSFTLNNNYDFIPNSSQGNIFIYTITGLNLFTLHLKLGNRNLPVIIDRTNNFFVASTNVNVKPSVFKLVFQQQ